MQRDFTFISTTKKLFLFYAFFILLIVSSMISNMIVIIPNVESLSDSLNAMRSNCY